MTASIDLANPRRNGAYLVSAADLDPLEHTAHGEGFTTRRINLSGCARKDELLERFAAALEFPTAFGRNWDALADCLNDLAWLPHASGYVWLLEHAESLRDAATASFDTLCNILEDSCVRWRDQGVPCFAFLALPAAAFPNPPH